MFFSASNAKKKKKSLNTWIDWASPLYILYFFFVPCLENTGSGTSGCGCAMLVKCILKSGIYRGLGTTCFLSPCPSSGACIRAHLCLPHTGTSDPPSTTVAMKTSSNAEVTWVHQGFRWWAYPPECSLSFKFMSCNCAHRVMHCWGARSDGEQGQEEQRGPLPVVTEARSEGRDRTRQLHLFPRALPVNYRNVGGFKQHKFTLEVLEASLKSGVSGAWLFWKLWGACYLPLSVSSVSRDFLVCGS